MNSPGKLFILIFHFYILVAGCSDIFGQYHFDTWTTDNGLPQNGLREITQTPDGYLWFTTFDGLVRFDGVHFTTFGKGNTEGIINNRFTYLYSDRDGTLYAATTEDGVLTIYRDGVFSSYTSAQVPSHYIKLIQPDESGELRFLAENEGHDSETWYYLRDGEFILSETRSKTTEKLEYRGSSGTLWTLTPTEVFEEPPDGKTVVYPHQIKRLEPRLDVFEDSGGALWIGGLTLSRVKDGQIETFGKTEGFPHNADFHSFWEEADGSVWFANGGQSGEGVGLARYQSGSFSIYGKEAGLSSASIFDVFKDREGTVWLATNKGLNRLRKKVLNAYSVGDGLNNAEVYPIYRDTRDQIWIGTIAGLSLYRNGKFEDVRLQQAPQDIPESTTWKNGEISVQSITEDSYGKMWIGVNGGIFVVENGIAELLIESEGHHVFAFKEDRAGNVWAASHKGILLFENYRLKKFYSVADGLPNEFMTVIHEDSHGKLWFGGLGGLTEFRDGQLINYTTREGLTGNYVRSIYEDREGVLWIGTYDEGLSRFENDRFVNYRAEHGLFNNGVFAIEEDERGNFWISSNGGIYRVNRHELNDFAAGQITRIHSIGYGKEDGMLNNECNGGRQPASIRDPDGNFWFPTQDGVVVLNPEVETLNALPPSVVIESATVEREAVDLHGGLVIEPGQKNVEIKFTGISLIKSDQIKFKYKLDGHDPDWVDADTRRTAYYSYLPPGNYRFQVIAANSDGVWNEIGAVLDLELKPYFYQTGWFYLLGGLIGILGLFGIWKISVYQLKARERLLKKLVGERTEELKKANRELEHLANSDGLTGVANRRRFEDFLAGEWLRAVRSKSNISLILIDIDHFKLFNDRYGHQAGDETLKQVAEAITKTINRPTDLAARFGGEEFAVILGGTGADGALSIAEHVLENVRDLGIAHSDSATSDYLTVSLGVATMGAELGMTETELIGAADEALYQAKEDGRNRIVFREPKLAEEFVGLNG